MSHERDCPICGSPIPEGAVNCRICAPRSRPAPPIPDDRIAGEPVRGIIDFELKTAKAEPFTRSRSPDRGLEVHDLDELWWVRSNLRRRRAASASP